jgi:hypothetical protein
MVLSLSIVPVLRILGGTSTLRIDLKREFFLGDTYTPFTLQTT